MCDTSKPLVCKTHLRLVCKTHHDDLAGSGGGGTSSAKHVSLRTDRLTILSVRESVSEVQGLGAPQEKADAGVLIDLQSFSAMWTYQVHKICLQVPRIAELQKTAHTILSQDCHKLCV